MPTPNITFRIHHVLPSYEKTHPEFAKYTEGRHFFSCNKTQDFLKYIQNGSAQPHDFVEYEAELDKHEKNAIGEPEEEDDESEEEPSPVDETIGNDHLTVSFTTKNEADADHFKSHFHIVGMPQPKKKSQAEM